MKYTGWFMSCRNIFGVILILTAVAMFGVCAYADGDNSDTTSAVFDVYPQPTGGESDIVVVRDMRDVYMNSDTDPYPDMPSTMPDMPSTVPDLPSDSSTITVIAPQPTDNASDSVVVRDMREVYMNSDTDPYPNMPSTMPDMPSTVPDTPDDTNSGTTVSIGAAQESENKISDTGSENSSTGTASKQKDPVLKTGEQDHYFVLLPIFILGLVGMIVFGRKRNLYECG